MTTRITSRTVCSRHTPRLNKEKFIIHSGRRNSKRLQLVSTYTKRRKLDPNIASDSGYGEDDSAEFATNARGEKSGWFSESIGVTEDIARGVGDVQRAEDRGSWWK